MDTVTWVVMEETQAVVGRRSQRMPLTQPRGRQGFPEELFIEVQK